MPKKAKLRSSNEWIQNNRKEWNEYQAEYNRTRRANDPDYKKRLNESSAKYYRKNRKRILASKKRQRASK